MFSTRVWQNSLVIIWLTSNIVEAAAVVALDLVESAYSGQLRPERRLESRQQNHSSGVWTTDINWNPDYLTFFVDVSIGEKNQKVKLAVVQHPSTWVAIYTGGKEGCDNSTNECDLSEYSGYYITDSTFEDLATSFECNYADKTYAEGSWARNTFRLGQLAVEGVNFGVSNNYTSAPMLGLETAIVDEDGTNPFPSFIEVMHANGLINSLAYSIYVGDMRTRGDAGGSLIFGGLDTAKFTGPLVTMDSYNGYKIGLLGVNFRSDGEVGEAVLSVDPNGSDIPISILNLGTAALRFPPLIFKSIMNKLGAEESNDYLLRRMPPDNWGLEFLFPENLAIFVPFHQLIRPAPEKPDWFDPLIVSSGDGASFTLGTPFYRGAYVVYDFSHDQLSIAQAVFNQSTPNIIEIGVNGTSVRDLGLNTGSSIDQSSQPSNKSSAGAIAGGVIGGIAIVALIVGGCIYRRRRRIRNAPLAPNSIPPPPANGSGDFGGMQSKSELPSSVLPPRPLRREDTAFSSELPESAFPFTPLIDRSRDRLDNQTGWTRMTSEERARAVEVP